MTTKEAQKVIDEIVALASPEKIIIFSQKKSMEDHLTSFKLCIVAETDSKDELRRQVYVEVASDIPYDVVIYTPGEWQEFSVVADSFAHQINSGGRVIYG